MLEFLIPEASSFAKDIDFVVLIVALLGGSWLVFAEYMLFRFIKRFRRREGRETQYISGEEHSQTKWVHIAHYLVIVCDVVILVFAIRVWYNVKQTLPPADETIRVIGQQWSWRFVHPGLDRQLGTADDVETVDELHVKLDKVYHFKLESVDVLHSFSVPSFRLKQDAVPGRVITGWFKPTKRGKFDIQCAEMCGIGHGIMQARLFIETEAEHQRWLNQSMAGRPALPRQATKSGDHQVWAHAAQTDSNHR
jgi:cytochrome c oxidase subunit 2